MRTSSPPVYWQLIQIYLYNLKRIFAVFFQLLNLIMLDRHTNLYTNWVTK